MNILITKKFVKDVEKELTQKEKNNLAQLLTEITLTDITDCKN